MTKFFLIEDGDVAKIRRVMKRLYTENRMNGDDMRDAAQTLQSVVDTAEAYGEQTEERGSLPSWAKRGRGDLEGSDTGRFFVIIDKKTGKAVSEIFDSSKEADAELRHRGGEPRTGQQVMDAVWHNPSREKLKRSGVIG